MLDLGSIVGDYSAVKKIKDNNGYALLQIYNYFLLQENEKKFEMRENQRYFMESYMKQETIYLWIKRIIQSMFC